MRYILITFSILSIHILSAAAVDSTSLNGVGFITSQTPYWPAYWQKSLVFSDSSWEIWDFDYSPAQGDHYEIVDGKRLDLYTRDEQGERKLFDTGTINASRDIIMIYGEEFRPLENWPIIELTSLDGKTFAAKSVPGDPDPCGDAYSLSFTDTSWEYFECDFIVTGHHYEILDGSQLTLYTPGYPAPVFATGNVNEAGDEITLNNKVLFLKTSSIKSSKKSAANIHLLHGDLQGKKLYDMNGRKIGSSTSTGIRLNRELGTRGLQIR